MEPKILWLLINLVTTATAVLCLFGEKYSYTENYKHWLVARCIDNYICSYVHVKYDPRADDFYEIRQCTDPKRCLDQNIIPDENEVATKIQIRNPHINMSVLDVEYYCCQTDFCNNESGYTTYQSNNNILGVQSKSNKVKNTIALVLYCVTNKIKNR